MKDVHETCGRKDNKNKNNNEHEELSDDEKEEDEEHCNVLNDKKSSNVVTNNKKSKCEAMECHLDESDHEKECKPVECASVQLVKDLKGGVEKACVTHEEIKEDSVCTEVTCKMLVDNLKDELCRITCNSRDENCLEVEDTKKNIEK